MNDTVFSRKLLLIIFLTVFPNKNEFTFFVVFALDTPGRCSIAATNHIKRFKFHSLSHLPYLHHHHIYIIITTFTFFVLLFFFGGGFSFFDFPSLTSTTLFTSTTLSAGLSFSLVKDFNLFFIDNI